MVCVYILKSSKNGRLYIGSTNNLERRLEEHFSGRSKYTSEVLPLVLVFTQEYESLLKARGVECWLKRLKNKDIIERIILDGVIKKGP